MKAVIEEKINLFPMYPCVAKAVHYSNYTQSCEGRKEGRRREVTWWVGRSIKLSC